MQKSPAGFSPTLHEEAPKALSMYAKAITQKQRNGNIWQETQGWHCRQPPTQHVRQHRWTCFQEVPYPMLAHTTYLGHLNPHVLPLLMITFAHREHFSLRMPSQHTFPSLQQHQGDAICWLQLPVPSSSPSDHRVPAAQRNPARALSLLPVPGSSEGSVITKNKWHCSLCKTNVSLPGD